MSLILRALRWIDHRVFGSWQCSVCGCTDHFGCSDCCGWWPVLGDEHICTRCADDDINVALTLISQARGAREHHIAKIERGLGDA